MKTRKPSRADASWPGIDHLSFALLAVLCPLTPVRVAETAPGWPVAGQVEAGTPHACQRSSALAQLNIHLEGGLRCEQHRADARGDESDKAATTKLTDGWYAEEASPTGPFHWMSAVGHLDVSAKRGGTLTLKCHLRSIVPENSVDLFIDDKPVQSFQLDGTAWQDCLMRIPVKEGIHHLAFHSHLPGSQPPGDNRVLTICLDQCEAQIER